MILLICCLSYDFLLFFLRFFSRTEADDAIIRVSPLGGTERIGIRRAHPAAVVRVDLGHGRPDVLGDVLRIRSGRDGSRGHATRLRRLEPR